MKIVCPICFRDLETLDTNKLLPAHSVMPLMDLRCDGGDKTPEDAKKHAMKSFKEFMKNRKKK